MSLSPADWQQLIFSLVGAVGVVLISLKQKSGFVWTALSQTLFVFYFCNTDQYFLALQNVCLILMNIFGYYQWTKKADPWHRSRSPLGRQGPGGLTSRSD
jgi:nicotinamide riboside transporter PnuC